MNSYASIQPDENFLVRIGIYGREEPEVKVVPGLLRCNGNRSSITFTDIKVHVGNSSAVHDEFCLARHNNQQSACRRLRRVTVNGLLTCGRIRQELGLRSVVPLAHVHMLPGFQRCIIDSRRSASTALESLLEITDMTGRSCRRGSAGEGQSRRQEVGPTHLEDVTV